MKDFKVWLGGILIAVIAAFTGASTFGAAAPGTAGTMASTSVINLPANTVVTIAASSTCVARVITTGTAGGLSVTLDDKFSPTGGVGFWQAASTTVVYDAGQFGCGRVKAVSNTAQTLFIADVR